MTGTELKITAFPVKNGRNRIGSCRHCRQGQIFAFAIFSGVAVMSLKFYF
jgi:hypothetical protein